MPGRQRHSHSPRAHSSAMGTVCVVGGRLLHQDLRCIVSAHPGSGVSHPIQVHHPEAEFPGCKDGEQDASVGGTPGFHGEPCVVLCGDVCADLAHVVTLLAQHAVHHLVHRNERLERRQLLF